MRRWLAVLVLVGGCGFGYFVSFDLADGERRALPGTDLEVHLSNRKIAVSSLEDHRVLVQETVERKPHLELPLEGRACSLNVVRVTDRSAHLELVCEDGPAPGSPNAMAGSRALVSLPWALPGVVLGVIAGLLIRRARRRNRRKLALDTGVAITAAVGTAIAFPVIVFESWFRLTYAVAFVGYAFGGAMLGYLWARSKGTVIAALIAGVVAMAGATWFLSASRTWGFERAIVPMVMALMMGWGTADKTKPSPGTKR